jgi:hypothetical protein
MLRIIWFRKCPRWIQCTGVCLGERFNSTSMHQSNDLETREGEAGVDISSCRIQPCIHNWAAMTGSMICIFTFFIFLLPSSRYLLLVAASPARNWIWCLWGLLTNTAANILSLFISRDDFMQVTQIVYVLSFGMRSSSALCYSISCFEKKKPYLSKHFWKVTWAVK